MNVKRSSEFLVIGLDSSTTATKAIVFDPHGDPVAKAHAPISLASPQPNYYEQNPDDWWRSAQEALRKVTAQVSPQRITALAISNQRETFVPLDARGIPLRPAIIWLDERCKGEVEPFAQKIGRRAIHRITGKPVDYAPVVYRLEWMKRHEPALFKKIGMVTDVHGWLVKKMTGTFSTSRASADPLGLYDMGQNRWSEKILDALDLTVKQLPAVAGPGTVLGRISGEAVEQTGLAEGTLIVAGGGDGQAAGLGANVLSRRRAYLNLGTAVVSGIYGKEYRTSAAFRTMNAIAEDAYYYECSLRAGTFALDWFIRQILRIEPSAQPDIYDRLENEAARIPAGSDGLMHLPYLCGVMNPYWDSGARAAFVGLSSSHTRGHLYRSILEGIAFEQSLALRAVERTIGSAVQELMAIGGGSASAFWCQMLADVTGKRICIPHTNEASALGAAIAAAVGAGWHKSFARAAQAMTGIKRTFEPDDAKLQCYQQQFRAYRRIYPQIKTI